MTDVRITQVNPDGSASISGDATNTLPRTTMDHLATILGLLDEPLSTKAVREWLGKDKFGHSTLYFTLEWLAIYGLAVRRGHSYQITDEGRRILRERAMALGQEAPQ